MVFLQTLLRVGDVLHRVNAHLTLVAAQALKTDNAVLQRIQSIILALAHVQAGMDVGAALTEQDVARQSQLTIGALRAQTLGFAVAAVTSRPDNREAYQPGGRMEAWLPTRRPCRPTAAAPRPPRIPWR